MTARTNQSRGAASAICVELAIDDPELADSVRRMIATEPRLRSAGPADGLAPDVRVTDGAVEHEDGVPVIVLDGGSGVVEALQAGAMAVLSEHADAAALSAAAEAAMLGLVTVSPEFRDRLVEGSGAGAGLESEAELEPVPVDLTARERQVLQLLAQGASNKAIARRLAVTPHTVKFHVASIVSKLGATGRTDAVAKAMRMSLVMI